MRLARERDVRLVVVRRQRRRGVDAARPSQPSFMSFSMSKAAALTSTSWSFPSFIHCESSLQ